MSNSVPQKPRLYLPICTSEPSKPNAAGQGRSEHEAEAAATLNSLATKPPTLSAAAAPITVLSVNENGTPGVNEVPSLQETALQLQRLREQQQVAPFDRDFPPNVQVARAEGLATGMFCPLCLGDLYQFAVSEKRGFVMCPSRQVGSPVSIILGAGSD